MDCRKRAVGAPHAVAGAMLVAIGCLWAPQASAQSGCTATYVTKRDSYSAGQNIYRFAPTGATAGTLLDVGDGAAAGGAIGATALSPTDGLLYYFKINNPDSNTSPNVLYSWNPVTRVNTLIGTVAAFDPDPALAGDQIEGIAAGASFDLSGNLWVLFSGPGTANNGPAYLAQVSTTTGQVVAGTQKRILYQGGQGPGTAGSAGSRDVGAIGDLVINAAGQMFLYSNNDDDEPAIYNLNLATGQLSGYVEAEICSGVVDYFDGAAIMPNGNRYATTTYDTGSGRCLAGGGTSGTTFNQIGADITWLTDMAGCPNPILPPTASKSFAPASIAPGGVSVLTINVGNPNIGPAVLTSNMVDTLPTNVTRAGTGNLGGSCFSAPVNTSPGAPVGNTITSTAGSVTFAAGSIIPGGGCTITMEVTGTVPGTYTNTIAANALQTTIGSNAAAATANLVIAPLPTVQIAKTTVGATGTHSFTFTGTNNAAGSPTTISVTGSATQVGAVRTLTTAGTVTTITEGVPPAGFSLTGIACTGLGVGGTQTPDLPNRTVSLDAAATAPGSNVVCTFTNRQQTDVQVVKTASPVGPVVSGSQVAYTLTVTNNGPAAANGTVVSDPVVPGLSCTTDPTCSASPGAACPAPLAVGTLQGAGLVVPTLPSGASVALALSCTVTATGQ